MSTAMVDPVVIAAACRTPIGAFQGQLSKLRATALGAAATTEAVRKSGIARERVQQIFMGCVLPAGLGQGPARQVGVAAGLPLTVQATTVNKLCGSGMQAAIMAHDALLAGSADTIVAGGMESMSNAPYLLPNFRRGARVGHHAIVDSMYADGLEDAYETGTLMGAFAERCVAEFGFTRDEQDEYARESLLRAQRALEAGQFREETVSVEIPVGDGQQRVLADEQPLKADASKIPGLKPAFARDGTITAASSSSISDGAAVLFMTRASVCDRLGLKPLARFLGHAAHAHTPPRFAILPALAIETVLARVRWSIRDVDLFEVNEAFAVVPMITMRKLGIPRERMNVHGGACALGHPIGASGARIIVTLIHALRARGLKHGIAAICLGGGEATAVALEVLT